MSTGRRFCLLEHAGCPVELAHGPGRAADASKQGLSWLSASARAACPCCHTATSLHVVRKLTFGTPQGCLLEHLPQPPRCRLARRGRSRTRTGRPWRRAHDTAPAQPCATRCGVSPSAPARQPSIRLRSTRSVPCQFADATRAALRRASRISLPTPPAGTVAPCRHSRVRVCTQRA